MLFLGPKLLKAVPPNTLGGNGTWRVTDGSYVNTSGFHLEV